MNRASGKSQISSATHILHDPRLSPVVGHQVARWDDDAEMARILEQLQLGVHRTNAVHGRKAEFDVGGDVAPDEGFLFLGRDSSISLLFVFHRDGVNEGGTCYVFQYLSLISRKRQQQDLGPPVIQL